LTEAVEDCEGWAANQCKNVVIRPVAGMPEIGDALWIPRGSPASDWVVERGRGGRQQNHSQTLQF